MWRQQLSRPVVAQQTTPTLGGGTIVSLRSRSLWISAGKKAGGDSHGKLLTRIRWLMVAVGWECSLAVMGTPTTWPQNSSLQGGYSGNSLCDLALQVTWAMVPVAQTPGREQRAPLSVEPRQGHCGCPGKHSPQERLTVLHGPRPPCVACGLNTHVCAMVVPGFH